MKDFQSHINQDGFYQTAPPNEMIETEMMIIGLIYLVLVLVLIGAHCAICVFCLKKRKQRNNIKRKMQ